MAACCLDKMLGVPLTPSLISLWGPRISRQLFHVSDASRATIPVRVTGQDLLLHQRSSTVAVSSSKQKRSPVLYFDEDDEDEADSDGEETGILDLEEWMKNKPAGFGGGKVHDTSLEDRLLEEIKRDQLAQATAKAASKNKKPTPSVKPAKEIDNGVPFNGVEVFVKGLPRKKNVDRDIRAALSSVSGLQHIRALVSGNEKTREPSCTGLAFLTFATLGDAGEFVERYNGKSVVFGKVEKRIVCELAKVSSPYKKSFLGQPSNGPRLGVKDPLPGDLSHNTSSANSLSVEGAGAVEVAGDVKKSSGNFLSSDVEVVNDALDGNDSLKEDDADLFELEQLIWDDLENEEDFELDLELEVKEDNREGSSFCSFSEEGVNVAVSDICEDIRLQVDEDDYRPQVSGQGFGRSTISVESRETARDLTKKSGRSLDKKEKKIRELEAKLEELQNQLNKRNSVDFSRAKDTDVSVREQESKIESLEQRLLRRAKAGKDTNVSNGKATSSAGKSLAKKSQQSSTAGPEKPSKDRKTKPSSRLKLGASSRLKKREKEIFTEALSKYSAPSRD